MYVFSLSLVTKTFVIINLDGLKERMQHRGQSISIKSFQNFSKKIFCNLTIS